MLLSDRARSHSRGFSHSNRPKFQTKYKPRGNNMTINHYAGANQESSRTLNSKNQAHDRSKSFAFDSSSYDNVDEFAKTSSKLACINFAHHDPNLCVCSQCNCGRHLCQLHSIKPDLTKNTIYKKDFAKKKPIKNKVNISCEYDRFTGPNLELNTTYIKDFNGKESRVQKQRPEDLLKSTGPVLQLTSYSSGFPGHKGANQYVKPTDRHTRADFPLRSKSTYSSNFVGSSGKKDDWDRVPDNLRTGSDWFGSTTYGSNFRQPNPEDYASKYKNVEKLEKNPDYTRQYETVYRTSFIGHKPGVCPAKVILETKSKGSFLDSKSKFNENADFKAMDPNFHAISTSKHFYV